MPVFNPVLDKIIDKILSKIDNLKLLKEEFLKTQLNHLNLPNESLQHLQDRLEAHLSWSIQHKYWLPIQANLLWSRANDPDLAATQARFHDLLNRMEAELNRELKQDPAYLSSPVARRIATLGPRCKQEVLEEACRLQKQLILQEGN